MEKELATALFELLESIDKHIDNTHDIQYEIARAEIVLDRYYNPSNYNTLDLPITL